MDTANDNPIKRFSAFWFGTLLFVVFGLVCLLLAPWFGKAEEESYDRANSERRLKIRQEADAAQAALLDGKPRPATLPSAAAELLSVKPAAVEDNAQLVPGSPTFEKLQSEASAPAPDIPVVAADTPVDPAVLEAGKGQYVLCMACHGAEGQGVPNVGPPLAGSEWVNGPVENLIRIQLRGLQGPITVKGVEYNFVAPMAPQAFQTDEQVAAVLTYVRNSFGNKASPVTPEQVAAMRSEVGKPMLTESDLIPPTAGATPEKVEEPK